MSTIYQVGRAWRQARSASHIEIPVADSEWIRLFQMMREAQKSTEQILGKDHDLFRNLRRIGFRLRHLPFSIESPLYWDSEAKDVIQTIAKLADIYDIPSLFTLTEQISGIIKTGEYSPLWSTLLANWESLQTPIVIATEKEAYLQHFYKLIRESPKLQHITVNLIRNLSYFNEERTTIIFGLPSIYPEWLKQFPRSSRSVWIYHIGSQPLIIREALFSGTAVLKPLVRVQQRLKNPDDSKLIGAYQADEANIRTEINRDEVDSIVRSHRSSSQESIEVTASLLYFATGHHMFYSREDRAAIYALNIDDEKYSKIPVHELRAGLFVPVRKPGSRDTFQALIEERFLKNPGEIMEKTRSWKAFLAAIIRQKGLPKVANDLAKLGVALTQSAILNWTTDQVYGPGSYEHFRILFNYLYRDDVDICWQYLEDLRRAGRQAGAQISSELTQKVRALEHDKIRGSDSLTIDVDGVYSGALELYRVLDVQTETHRIPISLIGELLVNEMRWRD